MRGLRIWRAFGPYVKSTRFRFAAVDCGNGLVVSFHPFQAISSPVVVSVDMVDAIAGMICSRFGVFYQKS